MRFRSLRFRSVAQLCIVVGASLFARDVTAQNAVTKQRALGASAALVGGERSVDGRVRRPVAAGGDSTGMGAAAGAWVTVHRVAKDSAGPIDSIRTDALGQYRLKWHAFGSTDAVYFASVTWDGIAYFTAPLRSSSSRGDEAEITVFDTTSKPFPVTVRGRHLIVGKSDTTDMRTIIEVFELSNDSTRTLVSADGPAPAPTWSIAIPSTARDVRATVGEISPDAFANTAGRVSVFAPLAPGVKQLSFSYKVPVSSFPLTFVAEHGSVVFEVLLEEPRGTVTASKFANVDPVTLERRNFRRYIGQDVKEGERVLIDLPAALAPGRNRYIAGLLVGIGFLMLLVLGRAVQKRAGARANPPRAELVYRRPADVPEHERRAQEIAALDALYAQQQAPSDEVRVAYERRRVVLKSELADALAGATTLR